MDMRLSDSWKILHGYRALDHIVYVFAAKVGAVSVKICVFWLQEQRRQKGSHCLDVGCLRDNLDSFWGETRLCAAVHENKM
jgi:hypothetical protein